MKRVGVVMVLVVVCALGVAGTAGAATYISSYSSLPSYDMNSIGSGSTYYGINCGPTAGAEMIAYWDTYKGKTALWNPDTDLTGSGVNPNLHLCVDMGTAAGVGTTVTGLHNGLEAHAQGTCGNPSPPTLAPLPAYASATAAAYQKTEGVSFSTVWSTLKSEIDASRPVALLIGHYPAGYSQRTLYPYYNYHWQVVFGYDETGGAHNAYTRTGFASTGLFDLQTYWNYTKNGVGIDNIAICTLGIP